MYSDGSNNDVFAYSEPLWSRTDGIDPLNPRLKPIGKPQALKPAVVALLGVDVDAQMYLIDSRGKTRKTSVVSENGQQLVRERFASVRSGGQFVDIIIRMLVNGSCLEADSVLLDESDVIVVLFDVTNRRQFKLGKRICYDVICTIDSVKPVILLGNTSLIVRHKRRVKAREGRHFCQRLYASYMEIDVLDTLQVDEFHEQLAAVAFPKNGMPSHSLFDQGAPMVTKISQSRSRITPFSPPDSPHDSLEDDCQTTPDPHAIEDGTEDQAVVSNANATEESEDIGGPPKMERKLSNVARWAY